MRTPTLTKTTVVSGLLALLAAPALAASTGATEWKIDTAHTRIGFSVPHMMFSEVEGRFHGVTGQVLFDETNPAKSTVSLEIDAASVDTDNADRDKHLKSPDFFDVQNHPKLTFKSTAVKKAGKGYRVTGELSIRGVTRPVTLDVQVGKALTNPWGQTVVAVKATGKLNRKDFGLAWNKALDKGGVLVGDEVTLRLQFELNK